MCSVKCLRIHPEILIKMSENSRLLTELQIGAKLNSLLCEQNINNLPIDSVTLIVDVKNGRNSYGALDKHWLDDTLSFPYFHPINVEYSSTCPRSTKSVQNLIDFAAFLSNLLCKSFHSFWSEMHFRGDRISTSLQTYVQRCHVARNTFFISTEIKHLLLSVHIRFMNVIQRLLCQRESNKVWITPKMHYAILNKQQLITLDTLMGVCRLNECNDQLASTIVLKAFKICTYINRAKEVKVTIEKIRKFKYKLASSTTDVISVIKSDSFSHQYLQNVDRLILKIESVTKLSLHYTDIFECMHNERFEYLLIDLYNNLLPDLCEVLAKLTANPITLANFGEKLIQLIMSSANEMVLFYVDNIVSNSSNEIRAEEWFEKFLKFLDESFKNDLFIRDYNRNFELIREFEKISVFCPFIDKKRWGHVNQYLLYFDAPIDNETKNRFDDDNIEMTVLQTFQNLILKSDREDVPILEMVRKTLQTQSVVPNSVSSATSNIPSTSTNQNDVFSENEIQEMQKESLIAQVMDIIPNLGDGFVEKCLEKMGNNAEEVINAILENKLPKELQNIDRELIRIPDDNIGSIEVDNNPYLSNVARVTQGKHDELTDANAILNDKSEIHSLKTFYRNFKHVQTSQNDATENDDPPEPEAYEYNNYNHNDYDGDDVDDEVNSTDSEAVTNAKSSFKPFCRDPAEMRAEREAKSGHFRRSNASDAVVGKPRGQGQSKTTQRQRNLKTTKKSSFANHNRKAGATWKQSRGLF